MKKLSTALLASVFLFSYGAISSAKADISMIDEMILTTGKSPSPFDFVSGDDEKSLERLVKSKSIILVISAPSGTGKSTIIDLLLKKNNDSKQSKDKIKKIVSVVTRAPRVGERNGVDYQFITKESYKDLLSENKLVQRAKNFDNYYGIMRSDLNAILESESDAITDITFDGLDAIKRYLAPLYGVKVISIYIMPPSFTELEKRLSGRNTETPEELNARLSRAMEDMAPYKEYDYVLKATSNPQESVDAILAIYRAQELKRKTANAEEGYKEFRAQFEAKFPKKTKRSEA